MKQIATAFVAAQKAFGPALKTNTNPHFKSKYADLSACVEAVIDALNQNGIAMLQQTREDAQGVTVETMFLHESGESITSGPLHVPAAKMDPQGFGSALTYARRYSLMAACGIAPEDDDGNAASKGAKPAAKSVLKPLPETDMSPKARAARIASGVADGDAVNAAAAMAGWDDELRDSVWALLDVKTQGNLTAAWPATV